MYLISPLSSCNSEFTGLHGPSPSPPWGHLILLAQPVALLCGKSFPTPLALLFAVRMWHLGTWVVLGLAVLGEMVGLDLRGIFQPKWFHDVPGGHRSQVSAPLTLHCCSYSLLIWASLSSCRKNSALVGSRSPNWNTGMEYPVIHPPTSPAQDSTDAIPSSPAACTLSPLWIFILNKETPLSS